MAVNKLIERLRGVGIRFDVEEKRALTPKPLPAADGRRPAWQTALNVTAFVGWAAVLGMLASTWPTVTFSDEGLSRAVLVLEAVCIFEVVQIALGMARGNLALGFFIHIVRALTIFVVMPVIPASLTTKLVLLAYSLTECCRYPMYLAPDAKPIRMLRCLAPVVTFPLGAGAEAYAAYHGYSTGLLGAHSAFIQTCVALVVPINFILGGMLGYPMIIKKALSALKGKA